MDAYAYLCIYIHKHIYTHTHIHTRIHIPMHIHIHIDIHIHIHIDLNIDIDIDIDKNIDIDNLPIRMRMCMHTCAHLPLCWVWRQATALRPRAAPQRGVAGGRPTAPTPRTWPGLRSKVRSTGCSFCKGLVVGT